MRTTIARLLAATTVLVMCGAIFALPSRAQDLQTVKFNTFSPKRETTLAMDLGFFAKHGIQLEQSITRNSEEQAQQLYDGVWDITSADADDYVYWDQDFNADFFMFMVGKGPSTNHLWVSADIQSFDDLRGKVLATDSEYSGQSSILRLMLREHGLEFGRDYTFLHVGADRLPTLLDGRASGASLGESTANTDAAQQGLVHILARSSDYLPSYPLTPYGTTNRFAAAHPDLLLGFIGAIIDAKAWLLDPANQQAAIQSIMRTDSVDQARATQIYQQALATTGDISSATQVQADQVQLVEDLRVAVGLMDPPTPPTSKFVTSAWYDLALSLRGNPAGSSSLSGQR